MLLRSHGISHPTLDRSGSTSSDLLSDMMKTTQLSQPAEVKHEPVDAVFHSQRPSMSDELDDGLSVVSGDPMLSGTSPVLVDTSRCSSVSMDEVNMMQ